MMKRESSDFIIFYAQYYPTMLHHNPKIKLLHQQQQIHSYNMDHGNNSPQTNVENDIQCFFPAG